MDGTLHHSSELRSRRVFYSVITLREERRSHFADAALLRIELSDVHRLKRSAEVDARRWPPATGQFFERPANSEKTALGTTKTEKGYTTRHG